MRRLIDIAGQTFGKLTVIERAGSVRYGNSTKPTWLCRCECGAEKIITGERLRRGQTKSCGCLLREPSPDLLDGRKQCTKCHEVKPLDDFNRNTRHSSGHRPDCRECQNIQNGIYRENNREAIRERSDEYFQANRERVQRRSNETRMNLRLEVLSAYGGKCNCCGEARYEFLSIDHINGGGKEDREKFGYSYTFLRYLRDNNWPQDNYQVLCHNCNMAKGFYGVCPHQSDPEYFTNPPLLAELPIGREKL